MSASSFRLEGDIYKWATGGETRKFLNLTIPFGQCDTMFECQTFNARTGIGEQREEAEAHVKKLNKAMAEGTFTPSAVTAQTRDCHREAIQWKNDGNKMSLSSSSPLPLTNGQHRFAALRRLVAKLDKENPVLAESVRKAPIPVIIFLDGCPKQDFLRLQMGKAVDPAMLLSMRILTGDLPGKGGAEAKLALEVARILHSDPDSPFRGHIKFDSRGTAGLPFTSLCARGGSDSSFSLLGLVRHTADPTKAASAVIYATDALSEFAPELLEEGRCLAPPPDGSRGAATLLIGLGLSLSHLAKTKDEWPPSPQSLKHVADVAKTVFGRPVAGNISGPAKRMMMGELFVELFKDEDTEKHNGVPKEILSSISPSALAVPPLPKTKPKSKKRAKS